MRNTKRKNACPYCKHLVLSILTSYTGWFHDHGHFLNHNYLICRFDKLWNIVKNTIWSFIVNKHIYGCVINRFTTANAIFLRKTLFEYYVPAWWPNMCYFRFYPSHQITLLSMHIYSWETYANPIFVLLLTYGIEIVCVRVVESCNDLVWFALLYFHTSSSFPWEHHVDLVNILIRETNER